MASPGPFIPKSSSQFTDHLGIVPNVQVTITKILIFISRFPIFYILSVYCWNCKIHYSAILFCCCCCWLSLGLVVWPRIGDLFVSQNSSEVCEFHFFRADSELNLYHLFVWSNLNFLHSSLWVIFPTHSCLVLDTFCVNLLHSLIIWLIVLFLLLHKLHLVFCYVLSIFCLT